MNEDEARKAELVRAIELEDREAALLTREDRAQAEHHARAAMGQVPEKRAADRFIAARAEFASARLSTRHPGIARLLERSRWPGWVSVVMPIAALVAGLIANEFGTGKRLDLLAVPLLGMIAWNLLVYLWIAAAKLTGTGRRSAGLLNRLIARLAGFGSRGLDPGSSLHRAANAFESRWAAASAPLTNARITRTLHLSAALFAIGLIGGIFLRALVIAYYAGWESTFLGPQAVHTLLNAVLGPASWLTGIAIPTVDTIEAMRWTGADTGGVNAGPWIILYTATVCALVVVPRLLLAGYQGAKAIRFSRRFPVAGREDFHTRRLLRNAQGTPGRLRVTPYAYHPGEETRRRVTRALQEALGDRADVRFDEAIDYGAEDVWLADHPGDPGDDYHILLFTLAATPEDENHGALAARLRERIAADHPGTVLAAIIDESPFRSHFGAQAGLDERIAGRLAGWGQVLGRAGITPMGIDLSDETDSELAKRIESGLLSDGAMR